MQYRTLASTVEAAIDPVVSVDESPRIIFFDPAAELLFQHPMADAVETSLVDIHESWRTNRQIV